MEVILVDIINNIPTSNDSENNDSRKYTSHMNPEELKYLQSIDRNLQQLLKQSQSTSQSDAKFNMPRRDEFRNSSRYTSPFGKRYNMRNTRSATDQFADSFTKAMADAFLGSDFRDKIRDSLEGFADEFGISFKDMPSVLGKSLANALSSGFKNSNIGKSVTQSVDKYKNNAVTWAKNKVNEKLGDYNSKHGTNYSVDSFRQAKKSAADAQSAKEVKYNDASTDSNLSANDVALSSNAITIDAQNASIIFKNISEEDKNQNPNKGDISDALQNLTDDNPIADNKTSIEPLDIADSASKSSVPEDIANSVKNKPIDNVLSDLSGKLSSKVTGFLDKFGDVGKIGKSALSKLSQSNFVSSILGKTGKLGSIAGKGSSIVAEGAEAAGAALKSGQSVLPQVLGQLATVGGEAGNALSGLASSSIMASGGFPPLLIAIAAVTVALHVLGPAIEAMGKSFQAAHKAANRYSESRKKAQEEAQKRFEADMESIIKAPFEILEQAAQKVYDAWDSNLRLINGTQGYTKADLQDLLSAYSNQLRSEGLSKVISVTDITDSLAKVLQSGLSGKAAEEFAYQATKLNAEIPSQDFFDYADTYASIVANQVRLGQSQSDALKYANTQIEAFANNLLYADRQLTSGLTTGLSNGKSLFEQSTQIAQANKTYDISDISGVLTSVAAVTGAIAPDLSASITDAVYKAATGGNSTELVALRSLAETGASNSAFLKALMKDSKSVISTLFSNLSKLQNMSDENSMEVAEALSSLFGLSMDAFSRIDFSYLSDAVARMNTNSNSLDENLKLLKTGETTTSAEQLKMQQINEYLLNEGLSYVLDNETARAVQQHMWDEQLALEMQEATYGIEIKGAALELLEGIRETIDNIINLFNPAAWGKKLANLIGSEAEAWGMEGEIKALLEAGKIGNDNIKTLYQLTTRGTRLGLTEPIVNQLGGQSIYYAISGLRNIVSSSWDFTNTVLDNFGNVSNQILSSVQSGVRSIDAQTKVIDSQYSWGLVSKSAAQALLGSGKATGRTITSQYANSSLTEVSNSRLKSKLQEMLADDYLQDQFVAKGLSYDDWAATANKFGIDDLDEALKSAGYSETQVKNYFQQKEVEQGNSIQDQIRQDEQDFRDKGRQFWIDEAQYTVQLIDLVTNTNTRLDTLIDQFANFHDKWDIFRKYFNWHDYYTSWTDYFIKHTAFNSAYNYSSVSKVMRDEKKSSEDAIYALAHAWSSTAKDLTDPTVQTVALLSQILNVVNAIMQQNNTPKSSSGDSGLSLQDTFAALAAGMIKQT